MWHKGLFAYACTIGIDIFSTPFGKSAVDFLEQFEPSAYKIASFEITGYELIRLSKRMKQLRKKCPSVRHGYGLHPKYLPQIFGKKFR